MSVVLKAFSRIFSSPEASPPPAAPIDVPKKRDFTLRILVVGANGAGKSQLIHRYIYNSFKPDITPTEGPDLEISQIITARTSQSQLNLRLYFIELPQQEHGGPHVATLLAGLAAIIIVFDVTSRASLQMVDVWRQTIAGDQQCRGVPLMLIGSKHDKGCSLLSPADMVNYIDEAENIKWRFVSSLTGEGVREAVDALVAVAVPLVRRRARQAAQQPRVSLDSKPRKPRVNHGPNETMKLSEELQAISLRLFSQIRRDLSGLLNIVDATRRADVLTLCEQCTSDQSEITENLSHATNRNGSDISALHAIRTSVRQFVLIWSDMLGQLIQAAGRWETTMRELVVEFSSQFPFASGDAPDTQLRHAYKSLVTTVEPTGSDLPTSASFESRDEDSDHSSQTSFSSISRTISAFSHHTAASNATLASRASSRSSVSLPRVRIPDSLQTHRRKYSGNFDLLLHHPPQSI